MSGDYGVVMADLASAADAFGTQATTLAGDLPATLPTPSAGGDGADAAVAAVGSALVALHYALAGAIDEHGKKLTACHDEYSKTDVGIRHLYDDLLDQLD